MLVFMWECNMLITVAPNAHHINVRMMMRDIGGGTLTGGLGVSNGEGSITGRVLENGLPVSRRVMLYERKTGAYAGQTRSGSDGYYVFKRTNEALTYFIVSVDDNYDGVQYNLVGQDLISGNHDGMVTV